MNCAVVRYVLQRNGIGVELCMCASVYVSIAFSLNSSIVPEEDIDRTDVKVVKAPVTEMALEMGNAKVLNVIMLGVYVGYTEVVSPEVVWGTIEHKLAKKAKLLPLNKEAFEKGLEIGRSQR